MKRPIEKMQNLAKENKREAILSAAYTQFSRYGYRKTSMLDIATTLSISRASLYSYFENKDEIFRGVSISIHESALDDAKRCLGIATLDLSSKIKAALLARHRPFHQSVTESAHGAELHDEYSRLCGDIVADSFERFQDMLEATLKSANRQQQVDLKAASITAAAAAEILNLASAGLKRVAADVDTYEQRVGSFVNVFMRGLLSTSKGTSK
jgi:AcrR family transcriptional regulator